MKNRPRWGQGKTKSKNIRQSERDPNYQRRKKKIEAQRAQRQQEMLAMAEKYSNRVPRAPTVASRARSRSPSIHRKSSRSRSPPQGQSRQRSESRSPPPRSRTRRVSQSPPVPAIRPAHDPAPQMESDLGLDLDFVDGNEDHSKSHRSRETERTRARKSSRATSPPVPTLRNTEQHSVRGNSPPIPAVKHRSQLDNDYTMDAHSFENYNATDHNTHRNASISSRNDKYMDKLPVDLEGDGQFVPFIRSTNILDPAHAESPVPLSRENTAVSLT